MKKILYIILGILLFPEVSEAQVIDTTKAINTWQLMHNFTRFEEVSLDTNMHQLHTDYNPAFKQGYAYETIGILGHAMNHMDAVKRPDGSDFLFGRAWDPYVKKPERTIFFNTKTPFTSLAYYTIPFVEWREENVEVLHTQNASPFTNVGLEFNILSGKELYNNQATRVNRVGLFGSHAKNKYSLFSTFYYNSFQVKDNGGLYDQDAFLNGEEKEWWLYSMKLSEAESEYRNLSFFVTQKYNLFERKVHTDSTGVTTTSGKTLSLSHQLLVERQMKDYYDEVDSLTTFYDNYYYVSGLARDSAREDRVSNVIQVILGDPDYDLISARIYAGYLYRSFGMLSPLNRTDTIVEYFSREHYHDLFVGFSLAGPTTGIWDWVIDGKYTLAGYNAYDFKLNTTFSRLLAEHYRLGLSGSFERLHPHYFTNDYSSSFFQWNNDFTPMLRLRGEAFLRSGLKETNLRAGASLISNYIYWDENALPREHDREILLLSGSFERHFTVSGFNTDLRLLMQYTTAKEIMPLPLVAFYTSTYWKQSLFKGALIADLGFDLSMTSRYHGNAYMPATGQFYLQDEYLLGAYPFLDVFLAFRVQRTRFFVSYSNIFAGVELMENNFMTVYQYPMKPRTIRIGLVWTFYN